MKKTIQLSAKMMLLLIFFIGSIHSFAQNINLVASVDETPPLSIGQTFTYTLTANAGPTAYRGLQVYLNYNPSVVQLNSLTPNYTVINVPLANDTSTPGVIRYAAGAFSDITGTTVVFTVDFEVIGTSEGVMITHDLYEDGNPNGTGVTNSLGQNIIGTANDIILQTLEVEDLVFSEGFNIYPNPVKDILNIKTNQTAKISDIYFYTIDGKLIYVDKNINVTDNLLKIDISETLTNGLYFMTLKSESGEQATFKILVKQ
jgi:hypothetical protein